MTKNTTETAHALEQWQLEDAVRLKDLFERKKAEKRSAGERFTQELFAERNGISSSQMVWQYLSAHRPLNIQAAAAFARGLGASVCDFSPTLAREIDKVSGADAPRLRAVPTPQRQLQWVSADEAQLLSDYRACAKNEKAAALTIVGAMPKASADSDSADQG